MNNDWSDGVSIIVPTYKRPEGIRTALESLMEQDSGGRLLEVIVADNDGAASARDFVTGFAKSSKLEVRYVHVPEPGVSSARNGAMAIKRGRYVAFLDDDMEATSDWLSALLHTAIRYGANVVFGPIEAQMPRPGDTLNQHMQPFFSRAFDGEEGVCDEAFGMGGCLLDLARCDMPDPPFNTDMNEIGGEDDWLFSLLISRGMSMGWSPKALTYEHVPESRVTPDYFWRRNFAFGQGPTQTEAEKGPLRGAPGIIKWMLVGSVQTLIFAPLYQIKRWMKRPDWVIYHARFAQGIGKVLWWDGFSPRLYGSAVRQNKEA